MKHSNKVTFKVKKSVLKDTLVDATISEYVSIKAEEVRKKKKLKINEVSANANFSNGTIYSRIKTGKHDLSMTTFFNLCKGLDCKSSDLLPF
jgi:DNA-binding Xre family transcriptional regulator